LRVCIRTTRSYWNARRVPHHHPQPPPSHRCLRSTACTWISTVCTQPSTHPPTAHCHCHLHHQPLPPLIPLFQPLKPAPRACTLTPYTNHNHHHCPLAHSCFTRFTLHASHRTAPTTTNHNCTRTRPPPPACTPHTSHRTPLTAHRTPHSTHKYQPQSPHTSHRTPQVSSTTAATQTTMTRTFVSQRTSSSMAFFATSTGSLHWHHPSACCTCGAITTAHSLLAIAD
jgi:hypothetical protein